LTAILLALNQAARFLSSLFTLVSSGPSSGPDDKLAVSSVPGSKKYYEFTR
jgi:hypothetical protein